MTLRKYLSEFGLNTYTSYKTIVPIEMLNQIQDNAKYHIYMILSTPRVLIEKENLCIKKDGITIFLKKIVDGNEIQYNLEKFKLLPNFDHSIVKVDVKYPYDKITFNIPEESLNEYYEKNKDKLGIVNKDSILNIKSFSIDSQFLLNQYYEKNGEKWGLEILYIGQSYGKDGQRLAQDRLASHSTLQKILTDCHSKYQDKRIYILLLEISAKLNSSFDGISKQYQVDDLEDNNHIKDVMSNLPKEKQIINITEAALINYFKPSYNVNFIDNFPCDNHAGYRQYYDLDYNCITVELDMEFDNIPMLNLFTSNNSIDNPFKFIEYNLFKDENRKNMYDIFQSKND